MLTISTSVHELKTHRPAVLVGTVNGHGYDGQQNDAIYDAYDHSSRFFADFN